MQPTAPPSSPLPSESTQEVDVLIIGAGPVGLYLAFQLGLLGIRCTLIDAHHQPGGQPVSLYPDKPIYDLPGIPMCTGPQLMERLTQQVRPFSPALHSGAPVQGMSAMADGRWRVTPGAGHLGSEQETVFIARAVCVAAGVGAFAPKRLGHAALNRWEGTQLHYHPPRSALDPAARTLVVGGDEGAVDAAIHLADHLQPGGAVTLMHRRLVWDAPAATLARLDALVRSGALTVMAGQVGGDIADRDRLAGVRIEPPEGDALDLPCDQIAVFLGLTPKLGPLADWGLNLVRKQVPVDPATCTTELPGVFAVGDVVTYPGKKKLLLCGFAECVQAAFAIAEHLNPGSPPLLEYTSSSTRLQQRLGVL